MFSRLAHRFQGVNSLCSLLQSQTCWHFIQPKCFAFSNPLVILLKIKLKLRTLGQHCGLLILGFCLCLDRASAYHSFPCDPIYEPCLVVLFSWMDHADVSMERSWCISGSSWLSKTWWYLTIQELKCNLGFLFVYI